MKVYQINLCVKQCWRMEWCKYLQLLKLQLKLQQSLLIWVFFAAILFFGNAFSFWSFWPQVTKRRMEPKWPKRKTKKEEWHQRTKQLRTRLFWYPIILILHIHLRSVFGMNQPGQHHGAAATFKSLRFFNSLAVQSFYMTFVCFHSYATSSLWKYMEKHKVKQDSKAFQLVRLHVFLAVK